MDFLKRLIKRNKRNSPTANNFSAWVSALAHEIKNPLNTMRLNIDLLKEDWASSIDPQNEKAIKRLDTMDKEIGRLEEILNDFLRYARLPDPNPQKCNVTSILNELLDFAEPEAQQLGIVVEREYADDLPDLYVDSGQIKQALINILLNAYQSMSEGGNVIVEAKKTESSVQIDITDSGKGIPDDRLDKIFSLFYSTKEDGTGLGLSIAKRIIEMHNGKILVRSHVDKGTTFSIIIPILR